jgi:hypothetical protein
VGSAGAVGAWGVPGPGDGEDVPGSLLEGDILWIGEAVLIPKLSLRRFVPDGCEGYPMSQVQYRISSNQENYDYG